MKFRAKITELLSVRLFAQLLHTLNKCCKTFVLRVMGDKLVIVISSKDGTGGVNGISLSAWCEIPKEAYFSEYNMEGISPEDNEIYLEVPSDLAASSLSSLKSSHNVVSLKIKLTKKAVACLTFEIETQSANSTVHCTHDIPVVIVTRRYWNLYQEPELPIFNVSLGMPEIKLVRQTLDRMKNLATKLSVRANKQGKLAFSVDTYNAKCRTRFPDLRVYELEKDDELPGTPPASEGGSEQEVKEYSVEVEMKTVLNLIPTEATKPNEFICSLVDGRLLHLYYVYGEISLQYLLPGGSGSTEVEAA